MEADHYDLLGVPRHASEGDIRKAFRRLVLDCHPDRHPGDATAEERFKRISLAYSVLSDRAQRREYDLTLLEREALFDAAVAARQAPPPEPETAPAARRARRSRTVYVFETNELRAVDAVGGAAWGAVAAVWIDRYANPAAGEALWIFALISLAPLVGAWVGHAIGAAFSRLMDEPDRLWVEAVAYVLPIAATVGGAVLPLLAADWAGHLRFRWVAAPAAIGGGLAAALGAALGRAVLGVPSPWLLRLATVAVWLSATTIAAAAMGLFFSLPMLARFSDLEFFQDLFAAAAGAAAGSALGAAKPTFFSPSPDSSL